MNPQLTLKVLKALHENKDLIIPKVWLRPQSGFAKLRKQQYITINKVNDGMFKATLTSKGITFIKSVASAN